MYGNIYPKSIAGGKYLVTEPLGKGGYAQVYKVMDQHVGKEFAMKVIESIDSQDREIEMLQMLQHEGLPQLHDVFQEYDRTYIVMELVKGVTLDEYVRQNGKLSIKETVKIAKSLCEILEYLHGRPVPVIHGDLKPQNVMIDEGKVRLIDFGGAFCQYESRKYYFGTPGYAAPELAKDEVMTESDVYSFGKVMLFMLTGREILVCSPGLLNKELKRFGIGRNLRKIILKCICRERLKRYHSAKELAQALSSIRSVKTYLPGFFFGRLGEGLRHIGIGVIFYSLYLWKNMNFSAAESIYFTGIFILLCSYIPEMISGLGYRSAILECEYSIQVSQCKEG